MRSIIYGFNSNSPNTTPGTLLKRERIAKGLEIEHISNAIKIRKDYIIALEQDDYSSFESQIYSKGFLKLYAKFLGIDEGHIMALYRRYLNIEEETPTRKASKKSKISIPQIVITPRTIGILAVVSIIIGILIYLFAQYYIYQKPPRVDITSPSNPDTITTATNPMFEISGYTDLGTIVYVNSEPIDINMDGFFTTTVTLQNGTNIVVVRAVHDDNIGKETIKQIHIEYQATDDTSQDTSSDTSQDSSENNNDNTTEVTTFQINLQITGTTAWIDLIVDDGLETKQSVHRELQPGYNETFTATKSFSIVTGRPQSTQVSIDGTVKTLNNKNGVGSLTCELIDGNVTCQP